MDTNALIDLVHEVQGQLWVDKVNETHRTGRLCQWVSTFHPDKLSCHLDRTFHHGAFNAGMKMVFSDSIAWMVRFPRVGMVCDAYTDEKVAKEVEALSLIYDMIVDSVPNIHAWGPAASNILGLGPYIMMDFINGVSASDVLKDPNAERPTRLIREDISDSDIEVIYRQAHSILQNGGVDTFANDLSAPWWLLQDRPVNSAWDCKGDQPPKIVARYFKYLEIFIRVLEEEEAKLGHEERELTSLVKWSQASGAMWLHMLLSSGFNDHRSFPFTQLRQHLGAKWAKQELEAFAARKVSELDEYDEALEEREEDKALVDSGKMTKEEFIANAL
ncbi:hypothetical protein IFR04_004755 [Cadophora malorum]|uniref:Uncharacterized protein n=1 Tax=Cadophora malorum TaxID=108018 RepID=A0A8H7WC56_9HELO|nr:hypothetical protein IFR04_004755 [Cadophora malorum]